MTYSDDLQPVSENVYAFPPRDRCDICVWLNAFADNSVVTQVNLMRDSTGNRRDTEVFRLMVAEENALRAALAAHAVLPHRPIEASSSLRSV